MFVDKLHMPIALQKDGVIIEPANYSLKFNPIHQKYRNGDMLFSDLIKKYVLKIMSFIHE